MNCPKCNNVADKESKFNYFCDSYYSDRFHSPTDEDWLEIEQTFGIAPQELNSYFVFEKEHMLNETFVHDYGGPFWGHYDKDSVYNFMVGKDTRIFNEITEKLKGYVPYYENTSNDEIIDYYIYGSETTKIINDTEYRVCRLFIPGQQGVLRCLVPKSDADQPRFSLKKI